MSPREEFRSKINAIIDEYNTRYLGELIFLIKGADRDENGHIDVHSIIAEGNTVKGVYIYKAPAH